MSVISEKISVKKPVIPEQTNVPLDARTVCESVEDFPNIELPYLGMIVFTKSDGKHWKITELKEKQIGFISVADAQIAAYEEFVSGGVKYAAGTGIAISAEGVISCTVEPGSGIDGDFVTQDEFDTAIGDINSILDEINGEEV